MKPMRKARCVPLRAKTFYEQVIGRPDSPRIWTFTNGEDLQAMVSDIKKLRPRWMF